MLTHPTFDLLHDLGLHGMAKGFAARSQPRSPRARTCRMARPAARARGDAAPAEALRDPRQGRTAAPSRQRRGRRLPRARGLDRGLFLKLAGCDWIRTRHNLLITGPCGVGKSWLACALGHKACRDDLSVLYHRVPRLFAALALARGDGRYAKLLRSLARVNLLVLDDWGPEPLAAQQRRDLLEIVEDRYDAGSILITSQLPVDRWYDIIGDPTLADAVLDRVVHNAYRIELTGDSLRKPASPDRVGQPNLDLHTADPAVG